MDDRTIPDITNLGLADPNVPSQFCQKMTVHTGEYKVCRNPARFVSNHNLVSYQSYLCDDHLMQAAVSREWTRLMLSA